MFGKLTGAAAIGQGFQNLPFRWCQHIIAHQEHLIGRRIDLGFPGVGQSLGVGLRRFKLPLQLFILIQKLHGLLLHSLLFLFQRGDDLLILPILRQQRGGDRFKI